jgi:hypothetical protein
MVGAEFHSKRNVKHGGAQQYWGKSPDKNVVTEEGGHTERYPTTILNYPIRKGGGAHVRPRWWTTSSAPTQTPVIPCWTLHVMMRSQENGAYISRETTSVYNLNPQITNGIHVISHHSLFFKRKRSKKTTKKKPI